MTWKLQPSRVELMVWFATFNWEISSEAPNHGRGSLNLRAPSFQRDQGSRGPGFVALRNAFRYVPFFGTLKIRRESTDSSKKPIKVRLGWICLFACLTELSAFFFFPRIGSEPLSGFV